MLNELSIVCHHSVVHVSDYESYLLLKHFVIPNMLRKVKAVLKRVMIATRQRYRAQTVIPKQKGDLFRDLTAPTNQTVLKLTHLLFI